MVKANVYTVSDLIQALQHCAPGASVTTWDAENGCWAPIETVTTDGEKVKIN